jgi:hypothetical protein
MGISWELLLLLEAIREVFTGIEFAVAGRGAFKY